MCPRYWVIVRGSCKNDCMGVAQQSPECKGLKTCFLESLKIKFENYNIDILLC